MIIQIEFAAGVSITQVRASEGILKASWEQQA